MDKKKNKRPSGAYSLLDHFGTSYQRSDAEILIPCHIGAAVSELQVDFFRSALKDPKLISNNVI